MSGTEVGEYGRATGMVLQGLLASVELARADRHEEALDVVQGMRGAVHGLHGAAATARQAAASEATVAQEQMEALERTIGDLYEQERAVAAQVDEVEAQLAAQRVRGAQTRQSLEALHAEVALLQAQVAELHRRNQELRQWFWVPGYGAYLSIRALAEQDLQRLRSRREEMARLTAAEVGDRSVLTAVAVALDRLTADGEKLRTHYAELAKLRDEVEQRKKAAARRVVLLLNVELFYGTLLQRIADVERRLDDVGMMHELLVDAHDEAARLEHSLRSFAEAVDQGGAVLLAA